MITGSKIAKVLAWVVGAIGFIAGIFIGNIAGAAATLTAWLTTAFAIISALLAYYHFRNQEEANETLDKIARQLNNIEKNTKIEA